MAMLFDDESGYPSLAEAVEALRTVIGTTREEIDRLDRERKALGGIDTVGVPAGCTEMLGFYLSRERLTPHHTLFVLARVFRRFTQARPAKALYHPFFAVGVAGGELAANLYQEFAHLDEATDYARGIAEIAMAAQRSG
jgi:hypothetical protein